jgi:hypothetical protein
MSIELETKHHIVELIKLQESNQIFNHKIIMLELNHSQKTQNFILINNLILIEDHNLYKEKDKNQMFFKH